MGKTPKVLPPVGGEEIVITSHAYRRAKERFNLNKNALKRMALKSWDAKMPSDKWLNKNFGNIVDPSLVIKLHGNYIFIFRDRILVTTYPADDGDKYKSDNF